MDERLTEEQSQLRESAARLCRDRGGAKRARLLRDQGKELDAEAWRAIRAAGWLGLLAPEERGGLGLGAVELYVLLEQIGRHALMVPLLESVALAALLGDAPAAGAAAAVAPLLDGARLLAPAFAADGWTFRREPPPNATRRGDALVASGGARIAAFAQSADEFLAAIDAEGETTLCLLPRDHPGCTLEIVPNLDGSSAGRIALADAAIVPARIVARGAEAAALAAKAGDLLALGSAIELLGLAEAALDLALDHVKTRRQFGRPLGSFQALQHRLADDFVALEVTRALLHRLCVAWDQSAASPALIAAAKAKSARAAADAIRTALQLHGAIGYTDEHDIGIVWKRSLVLAARYGGELTQSARFARLTAEEG